MPASVDPEYRREIGQAVREAREQRGLSQRALGDAVGSSKNAVSCWERGQSAPTVENLRETCAALAVPPERLLRMTGGPTPGVGATVHAARASELADQLERLRIEAEAAVPDLMGALRRAERAARRLARRDDNAGGHA